jgi:hypothetical protein
MALVKNNGVQPRGFWDVNFNHVLVPAGSEAQFNMSENDYKKLEEILEAEGDPAPFELSGGPGGVNKPGIRKIEEKGSKQSAAAKDKEDDEDVKGGKKR